MRLLGDGARRCCDVPTSYPRTIECVLIVPTRRTTGVHCPDLGIAGPSCRNRWGSGRRCGDTAHSPASGARTRQGCTASRSTV